MFSHFFVRFYLVFNVFLMFFVILLGGDPFDREKYSAELAAGGVDGLELSDKPFYPEIYYDGEYHPICGIDFNDEAATMACRDVHHIWEARPNPEDTPWYYKERFTYGGRVVKTNVVLERDAMPVGACLKGESLDGCTAGGNAFGDFNAMDGRCKQGNPVGVQIVCQRQCRKLGERVFLEEVRDMVELMGFPMAVEGLPSTGACLPFLKNTTSYYLEDFTQPFVDNTRQGTSKIQQFASLLDVMGQKCSANVVKLICHSVFKECKEIDIEDPLTGEVANFMLPSLLCKTECERHKTMWDECYATMQKDSADKELFESNMEAMSQLMAEFHKELTGEALPAGPDGTRSPFSLLDCDAKGGRAIADAIPDEQVAASWILGRFPQTDFDRGDGGPAAGVIGWPFPRFMSSEMLYPEEFSTYTGPDGVSYEVPCTIPGEAEAFEVTCKAPFTKSILSETNRACVHACPVSQFSEEEYTTMWSVFVLIGLCSFVLNMFMVTTWKLAGRREFKATPFQLKSCVFLGLLYGIVETIPTLILKFDLPCTHPTEEEIGSSAWCYINRSSQYVLLAIMVNLCTLTIGIYRAIVSRGQAQQNKYVNVLSTAVPFLFMVIAYALDTGEEDVENYHLNVARHGFNCSMRFSNMVEEWLVLWLPFCLSCLLTAVFSTAAWWKIGAVQNAIKSTLPQNSQNKAPENHKKIDAARRRLIRIAAMVSVCLLLSLALVGQATVEQAAWTDYEEKKLDCLTKSAGTRNFKDYGLNEQDVVEDICVLPKKDFCSGYANKLQADHPSYDVAPFTPTCGWYPSKSATSLTCSFHKLLNQYPDDIRELWGSTADTFESCECPCSDLFDKIVESVERPSLFAMTLSFAAQSSVAAIVALNLGLKDDNLRLWKKFSSNCKSNSGFLKKTLSTRKKTSKVSAGDGLQSGVSKDYARDPSSYGK